MSDRCQEHDNQRSSIAAGGVETRSKGLTQRFARYPPLKDRTSWLGRVGVEKGGGIAGHAKSARVMPGDLSQGQFVIVCQPLYTVNTTNCRLIQMRTKARGARAHPMPIRRLENAPPLETPSSRTPREPSDPPH